MSSTAAPKIILSAHAIQAWILIEVIPFHVLSNECFLHAVQHKSYAYVIGLLNNILTYLLTYLITHLLTYLVYSEKQRLLQKH